MLSKFSIWDYILKCYFLLIHTPISWYCYCCDIGGLYNSCSCYSLLSSISNEFKLSSLTFDVNEAFSCIKFLRQNRWFFNWILYHIEYWKPQLLLIDFKDELLLVVAWWLRHSASMLDCTLLSDILQLKHFYKFSFDVSCAITWSPLFFFDNFAEESSCQKDDMFFW